jgi:filamentous hemagglutinin family protein
MNHYNPPRILVGLAATAALAAFAQTPAPPAPIAAIVPAPPILKPLGPMVINGSAALNPGGNLSLQGGGGAIVNWNKFNLPAGGAIQFQQPKDSVATLNRVLPQPVAIHDPLGAKIRVTLTDPAGVVHLSGTKTAAGTSAYLTGSTETSKGIITTPKGETLLATGATVSLIDSATPGIKVEITGAKSNATNLGAIMSEVGRIGLAGAMARDANRPNLPNIVNEGGRIFLQGGPNGRSPN